ncbi:MAG: hypothetical protein PHW47_12090 [Lachnospira sp.]|nr:hypothetical protein [Lachnospira sp.]
MLKQNHNNKRRIFATMTAVMLAVVLFFSYAYLLENAHHDCTGENCPICLEMEAAQQIISGFKVLPVLPLVIAVLCVLSHICRVMKECDLTKNTLITLKVELLN